MSDNLIINTSELPDMVLANQEPKSCLIIGGGGLRVDLLSPRPNLWFRLWQYLFLGFRWEKL